jgi:thiol-disulfide isomerase/thioredoxin
MKSRCSFKSVILVVVGLALVFAANLAEAESTESTKIWDCAELLDSQTISALAAQERFFASLFQLPSEYELASEGERRRLVNQWIKELRGNDYGKVTEAAAYLGIVKAKKAVKPLEEVIAAGRGGRIRWVCTRSLGQIGDKSSIPVLIGLLDDRNKDTRVYAKVSLAEITGVYLGDDKEKWKNWQTYKTTRLRISTKRTQPGDNQTSSKLQRPYSSDRLGFHLPDIYGRIVDSQDYANVPVLVMSGSCWCGGCQQDAEPLRRIAAEYAPKGLQTIRTVAGDNELAALDFQRHYRLGFVQLLDTNRAFEKRYNPDGWTFLMLADREGEIVYKVNSPHEKDWRQLRSILNKMLSGTMSSKTIIRDGIAYMPATLQRTGEIENRRICDRFPSVACTPDSKVYVVFTTNRNGSDDVFIRVFDGSKWSEDMPIAATDADEYDSTVVVDKQGRIWVCWTSNAGGKNYKIFVMSFTNPSQLGVPVRLTHSDDAMHPRMACDESGWIWITYYKWHKMGRYSRDKEVYLRKLKNGKWSDELQISPTDVPQHEDHSDPAISAYGDGVIVAWSWDFHPPNRGYSKEAEAPTIFIRTVNDKMALGKISSVSGKNIDVTPAVVASDNRQIWSAWDSLGWNQRKRLCVGNPHIGRNNPISKIWALNEPVTNVCSPYFAISPTGHLMLLWSETQDGSHWALKRLDLDISKNRWSKAEMIESQGNPRFCSAAYGLQGQLWIAYSGQTKKGREIVVKNLGKERTKTDSDRVNNNATFGSLSSNTEAISKLCRAIDEKYSYRDLRNINWDKMFDRYSPLMERAKTPRRFAEIAAKMLAHAEDMHLWVKNNGETVGGFKCKVKRNYNIDLLRKKVPDWRDLSKYVSTGRFPDGIGYILIKSWRKNENQILEPTLKALKNLSNNRALIIDVRPNGGGSEPFAQKIAGCFVEHPVVYAKHVYKNANKPGGWGEIQERILRPNKDRPQYRGRIAVLMGQVNMSSCEAFLLMMKQVRNCKLIGDRSYGSSGNPKPVDLGNGVTVWLPSWKALRSDGSCFEGKGIKPDILVRTTKEQLRKSDRVLETALMLLRKP